MNDNTFPLISVITVVKGQPSQLMETFMSLKCQTSSNFEWVVQDSSDTQCLDSDHYMKASFSVNYSFEIDKSLYNAMNIGLLRAKGRYLIFLNAGDLLYSSLTIANIMSYIDKTLASKNSLSLFFFAYFDEASSRVRFPRSVESCMGIHRYRTSTCHQATVYDRHLFNYFIYDETLRFVSDHALFWRLTSGSFYDRQCCAYFYCDEPICSYSIPGLSSTNYKQQALELYSAGVKTNIPYVIVLFTALLRVMNPFVRYLKLF